MSFQIFYDKAFIKVKDKYIPMVCQGSSNCWEIVNGREVREKNWFPLRISRAQKIICSREEIAEIAEHFDAIATEPDSFMCKGNNRAFQKGEFEKWFLSGMKHAFTVEEYVAHKNRLAFLTDNFNVETPIFTEGDLMKCIEKYAGDKYALLVFCDREVRKPFAVHKKKPSIDFTKLDGYYVIRTMYLYVERLTSRQILMTPNLESAKKFVTKKETERYLKKYAHKFARCEHSIVCIQNNR